MEIRFYSGDGPELAEDFLPRVKDSFVMACLVLSPPDPPVFPVFHEPEIDEEGQPYLPVVFTLGSRPARPGMLIASRESLSARHLQQTPQAEQTWPQPFVGLLPIRLADTSSETRVYLEEEALVRSFLTLARQHVRQRVLVLPFEQASAELFEYFAKNPEAMYDLPPRRYEELIAAVFRNQGMQTELTPISGDRGIDLRIVQHDSIGRLVTLAQLKRFRSDRPVDLGVVQALSGAVTAENAHRGLVVTTSRFLPGVQKWIDDYNVRISLATNKEVVGWLQRAGEYVREQG